MGKARHLANLLNSDGDVKLDHLDRVPASNDASALSTGTLPAARLPSSGVDASSLTTGTLPAARLPSTGVDASSLTTGSLPGARLPANITDTGTEGTKLAAGTTAQRGSTAGQMRYNSENNVYEYYNGSEFEILAIAPTLSSSTPASLAVSNLPANVTLTGTGLVAGATVKFIGADGTEYNSGTVTVSSDTSATVQAPNTLTDANEPYDIKFINPSSLNAILSDVLNINGSPTFTLASGSLGTLAHADRAGSNLTTITATDPESDAITFTISSGTLPNGITLGSNGVFGGTADAVSTDTTYNFTVQASDGTNTNTRDYSCVVIAPVDTVATGGSITTYNDGSHNWKAHTFTSSGTFAISTAGDFHSDIEYLIVAGGAGGGGNRRATGCGGGGGAGGMRTGSYTGFSAQSYTVTVGGGGGAGGQTGNGGTGGNSSIFSITSNGGGGGGSGQDAGGQSGGSGGGGGYQRSGGGGTSGQGNSGASGQGGGAPYYGGGGGGKSSGGSGRSAGNGTNNSYNNTTVLYAKGGQGGAENGSVGADGGGANTGGGGGAGAGVDARNGRAGSSGIVVVRYKVSSI